MYHTNTIVPLLLYPLIIFFKVHNYISLNHAAFNIQIG